nr:YfdQ family protein [Chenggangzhangella methanolivorans]
MAQRTELPDDLPKTASAVEAIAKLAQAADHAQLLTIPTDGLGPGLPPAVPTLYEPRSQRLTSLRPTIEEFRQEPRAREGKALVLTLASFIALMNRHKDEDSAIFAETRWPTPKLTGVVDYHKQDHAPRHGRHTVVYEFPITEELKAWQANDGVAMGQREFAAFLEEHAAELSAPFDGERQEFEGLFKETFGTPSEVLALSRDLEVYVGQRVKRQERLSSGERTVEFAEEHPERQRPEGHNSGHLYGGCAGLRGRRGGPHSRSAALPSRRRRHQVVLPALSLGILAARAGSERP